MAGSTPEPRSPHPTAPEPTTPEPAEPEADAGRNDLLFGAYTFGGVWQGEEPLRELESRLGRRLDVAQWFMNWSHTWDEQLVRTAARGGRLPLIAWQPKGLDVGRIAAGELDIYLLSWAAGARAYGEPLYLRPFPEMNGNWVDWNGDPEGLKTAWRRMTGIFREAGASEVRWVWSPNVNDQPRSEANRLEHYYPGADVVDVLALDGYNWGTVRSWSDWRSFETIFAEAYARVTALGEQRVWITETACAEQGGDKAAWVRAMFASRAFPKVEAIVWFDENKEADWRINSSGAALTAFRETLGETVLT